MLSLQHPSNWRTADLQNDQRWILRVDEQARQEMIKAVVAIADPAKSLFDYGDFFVSFLKLRYS